jgi:hypothetical protein
MPIAVERLTLLLAARSRHAPFIVPVGVTPFTPQERDLIRREMEQHFGHYPGLADGIFLRA